MLAAEQGDPAEKQRNKLQFLNSIDSMLVLWIAFVVVILLSAHSSLPN